MSRPCKKCSTNVRHVLSLGIVDWGTGRLKCNRCGGSGELRNGDTCPRCDGKGEIECPRCDGTGVLD